MNNSQREQIIDITMGHEGGLSRRTRRPTLESRNRIHLTTTTPDERRDAGFPKRTWRSLEKEQASANLSRQMFYEEYGIGEIDDFSIASHTSSIS